MLLSLLALTTILGSSVHSLSATNTVLNTLESKTIATPPTTAPANEEEQEIKTGSVVGDKQWGGPFVNTKGAADPNFTDHEDMYSEIQTCKVWHDENLVDNSGGTANYYFSTPDYNDFKGVDLVPELKDLYLRAEKGGANFLNNLNFRDARVFTEPIKIRTCSVPSKETGFTWTVQRIGPFESTGNYDWWQIGYADFAHFKKVLKEHPHGLMIDAQNLVPVRDGTWERLEYPPLHIHHVHAVPDPTGLNVHARTTFAGYNFSLLLEQHGDCQCTARDGGLDCLMTKQPKGTGKFVDVPLSMDGELNDVRPPRSEKMKWWFEMAVRWTADLTLAPNKMSFMGIASPGKFDIDQQLTYVVTYPAPTDEAAFLWYSGKMWTDGKMITNRIHSHSAIFHSAYFIAASPADLGLDDPKFMPSRTYLPFKIRDLGYDSIASFATWILEHLDDPRVQEKSPRPKIICRAHVSGVVKNGFIYDRRPADQCQEFEFKEGDDFTVLVFSKHEGYPAGAHAPNVIPDIIPNHGVWGMYYIDYKQQYFADFAQYSQTGMVFSNKQPMWIIDILMMELIYGGVVQASVKNTVHLVIIPFTLLFLLFLGYGVYKWRSLYSHFQQAFGFCHKPKNVVVEYMQLAQDDEEDQTLVEK